MLNDPIAKPDDSTPPRRNLNQLVGPWLDQQTGFDHPAHFEDFYEYAPPDPNVFHDDSFRPVDPLYVRFQINDSIHFAPPKLFWQMQ